MRRDVKLGSLKQIKESKNKGKKNKTEQLHQRVVGPCRDATSFYSPPSRIKACEELGDKRTRTNRQNLPKQNAARVFSAAEKSRATTPATTAARIVMRNTHRLTQGGAYVVIKGRY
eukprot:GHVT01100093.1.p1 GENE.GHVT01100093.1~~GHVT01100093.1.p1  ORF type:complete len:116 (+),score=14.50 GHVT01100093.1:101-448(+)